MMASLPDTGHHLVDGPAADAAASWFARLNADRVSISDLQAFQAWRRDGRNDQAYRRVEALYAQGEALQADPDIAKALSAALGRPARPSRPRRAEVGIAVAATLLLALTFGLWAATGRSGEKVYQTAVGQQQDVKLSDGSVVRLDTDSQLVVRFAASRRGVALLKGRAFFAVAHDPQRPFIVAAGDAQVRAVGTRFSVQRDPAEIQVVLVQGVVAVSSGAAPFRVKPSWTLQAGQELTVNGGSSAPAPIDVAVATSWMQDRLTFRNLPLQAAIAEINRYTTHKLTLDAPGAADTPVSGVFNASDPVAFANAAADVCGLEVMDQADGTYLLRPKGAAPPA